MRRIREMFPAAFVTEAVDEESLNVLLPVADAIQIGSRNCLNYALLKSVGRTGKPVLLKRGFAATMEEYLNAAEYLALNGSEQIILCERGIRTMTEISRFTLDIGALAWLKNNLPLPVIADPSHAAGNVPLTFPLAMAAVAAGADGLLVECDGNPDDALCDRTQQLNFEQFHRLRVQCGRIRDPHVAGARDV